ncbi:MAG TPA: fused MFS/spermidine synthase [Rhizomicrobium sp.]
MARAVSVIEQNNRTGGVSYWQAADNQSVADRRGVSLADYIHAIYSFLRQAKSRNVLMIGGGGGTLATMLRRAGVKVTIVDIDGLSFEIARRYFKMPSTVECHVGDGASFLRRSARRFDAIVLDAFSDEVIPKHFLRSSFFDLVKAHLKPRGIFLVNIVVAGDDDPTPDRIARLMGRTWHDVRLLDSDGWENRNAIALAGAVKKLKRPRLLMRPQIRARQIAAELRTLDFRALR